MAARRFFLAWCGEVVAPPFELLTTGDLWGGSVNVSANVWGGRTTVTADISDGSTNRVTGIPASAGLREGVVYGVQMTGVDPSVTMHYLGGVGYIGAGIPMQVAASMTLVNDEDSTRVILSDVRGLQVGGIYGIAGSGIPQGDTFTFAGSNEVTISAPATASGVVSVRLSLAADRDIIRNLADPTGLVVGEAYDVFGSGLPQGAIGTWNGEQLVLDSEALVTGFAVPLLISRGTVYSDGGAFDPIVHARRDEDIISLRISHAENDFPLATLIVRNPSVGLLGPGRPRWAWISESVDGADPESLLHGRLVGAPESVQGATETLRLTLIARSEDHALQKAALAAAYRASDAWDPIWFAERADDPDATLAAQTRLWHYDRLSLAVSTSDILNGEDGTLTVGSADHPAEPWVLTRAATNRRQNVSATVTWTQFGEGDIDLTPQLHRVFRHLGETEGLLTATGAAEMPYPIMATFTGEGFQAEWPAPGTAIGGGWSVGALASLTPATWIKSAPYGVRYLAPVTPVVTQDQTGGLLGELIFAPTVDLMWGITGGVDDLSNGGNKVVWDVLFPLSWFAFYLPVHYSASRSRTEILSFSLEADVQDVVGEAGVGETDTLSLNSQFIDQPIDPGGALPIGDLRRNLYFPTDRGGRSVKFLMRMGVARLAKRARAVTLKFLIGWDMGRNLSCRWNVDIWDRRLPGGHAIGKVIAYALVADGSGNQHVEVQIGCSVGHGTALDAPAAGVNDYIDDYIDDYYQESGGQAALDDRLLYQSLDDVMVIDDDGVDLFRPESLVYPILVTGGPREQMAAISAVSSVINTRVGFAQVDVNYARGFGGIYIAGVSTEGLTYVPTTPGEALEMHRTRVGLRMKPVEGGAFTSAFFIRTSKLVLPKGIDLEAGNA